LISLAQDALNEYDCKHFLRESVRSPAGAQFLRASTCVTGQNRVRSRSYCDTKHDLEKHV
jgi:hypothetical protein